jgi:hypothetical protein
MGAEIDPPKIVPQSSRLLGCGLSLDCASIWALARSFCSCETLEAADCDLQLEATTKPPTPPGEIYEKTISQP